MVYLPACCAPEERSARPPRWVHGLLAVALPFVAGILWGILIHLAFPNHPNLHFPPIGGYTCPNEQCLPLSCC